MKTGMPQVKGRELCRARLDAALEHGFVVGHRRPVDRVRWLLSDPLMQKVCDLWIQGAALNGERPNGEGE